MVILPKVIYRFNTFPIKTTLAFLFLQNGKDPQIHMEALNSPNNVEKEKQSWRTRMSRFQNLLQSYDNPKYGTVIRIDERKKNQDNRNKPNINSQLVFDKGATAIQ